MNNTITVSIPVSPETIEKEVTLPTYKKDAYENFYKVLSEHRMVTVCKSRWGGLIAIGKLDANIFNKKHFTCTPSEFESAYNEVMEKLTALKTETV